MPGRRHGRAHRRRILQGMDTHELQEGPILGYLALMVALAMMLAA